eukprot:365721-Chlamydomonas_euryale.AAC.14
MSRTHVHVVLVGTFSCQAPCRDPAAHKLHHQRKSMTPQWHTHCCQVQPARGGMAHQDECANSQFQRRLQICKSLQEMLAESLCVSAYLSKRRVCLFAVPVGPYE